MSDTPRTDEMCSGPYGDAWTGMHSFARELERELNAEKGQSKRLREALQMALDDVDGLIQDSYGVAGLHLNGDIAPWEEVDESGRFERFGFKFFARTALASTAPEPLSKTEQLAEPSSNTDELVVDLKACPFCGSNEVSVSEGSQCGGAIYYIECHTCSGMSGSGDTEQEAEELWNDRISDGIPRADIEPLLSVLHSIEIGGCNCHTKSPELVWHKDWCRYKQSRQARETFTAKHGGLS